MERLVQILADAVSVGSLYALTALGIGLIFGVMRLINFAHGELITFAAYALLALFGQPRADHASSAALRWRWFWRWSPSAPLSARCATPTRRRF